MNPEKQAEIFCFSACLGHFLLICGIYPDSRDNHSMAALITSGSKQVCYAGQQGDPRVPSKIPSE
jgi:hypothetical protein